MRQNTNTHLLRALGLTAIIIYGVGDILGAGIYAIVGKIAGHAGPLAWLSFAIAMGVVFLTALSYSELGSRYPRSGGVSVYIQEAFNREWLSILAGILLFSATVLSMSTLSQAFVGYLRTLGLDAPAWVGVTSFLTLLLIINLRGIKQSSFANMISTAVEVSGLIIVLIAGLFFLTKSGIQTPASNNPMPSITQIFQGAALAFFAFTGFEDLANIAEEIKQPEKNLPRAILSALGIAGILYLAVSWTATAIIPGKELGQSHAPLFDVVHRAYPSMPTYLFSFIAMFAVFNTTLLNYITASRLLYGMSEAKLLPTFLQKVHPKYRTPYIAILFIFPLVLILGITGTLGELASSTSALVLTVFSFSCVALIRIKWREGRTKSSANIFRIPAFIPWLAVTLNMVAITFLPVINILYAVGIICAGIIFSSVVILLRKFQ